MELQLENIGVIKNSTIELNGLTVITGINNSGKSTAGKVLYAVIEGLNNLKEKRDKDLVVNFRRACFKLKQILDIDFIAKYLDMDKLPENIKGAILRLESDYLFEILKNYKYEIENDIVDMKQAVEALNVDVLSCSLKEENHKQLSKKLKAYFSNFDEAKQRAVALFKDLEIFFGDSGEEYFSRKKVLNLIKNELNGEIFPKQSKADKRISKIRINNKLELICDFSIENDSEIVEKTKGTKRFFYNNAIYVEDAYILDRLKENPRGLFSTFSDFLFNERDTEDKHQGKLKKMLINEGSNSIIEQSIQQNRLNDVLLKLKNIVPGELKEKDGTFFYEEEGRKPLRVENLATGSKIFSILKTLLQKGELSQETMLILDEPEAHLHPQWQNSMAEFIVLLVKEVGVNILLTTHSPNFLAAIEYYMYVYNIKDKCSFYKTAREEDNYMVNYQPIMHLSEIYDDFEYPYTLIQEYLFRMRR